MKLLAVDYDGTFYGDIKNLYLNKKAIQKFRKDGNKFAIVTGRSYESIKREINNYNIRYDYLSCNNGLVLFDNNDNIINSFPISREDLNYICFELLKQYKTKKIHFFNERQETRDLNNILNICVSFNNFFEAYRLKEYLKENMQHISCDNYFFQSLIGNKYSKADAVAIIQQLENIDYNDIYTVGDNINDLDMLKRYNGYKMLSSYPCLWLEQLPVTREVHTLVKKISKNKN